MCFALEIITFQLKVYIELFLKEGGKMKSKKDIWVSTEVNEGGDFCRLFCGRLFKTDTQYGKADYLQCLLRTTKCFGVYPK